MKPPNDSLVPQIQKEIDITDVGRAFWKQKILITTVSLCMSGLAFGISLALPKTYTAESTILPVAGNDTASALAAGIAAQFGPAAAMLGSMNNGKTSDLIEILGSRTMTTRVIEKCNLEEKLGGWKHRSDLIEKLNEMTTISGPTLKNKLISIRVDAKDPSLSAAIANAYVDELKKMLDEIGYNSSSRNRKFIETQLDKAKKDLIASEDKLSKFQVSNNIISLPETILSSIKSISELEAQKIYAETQLQSTDETLDAVKTKVSSLQANPNLLTELEIKRKGINAQRESLARAQANFVNKLSALPPKGMELARLQRDVQVYNTVYLALTQQLETAIIDENSESDAFIRLDVAQPPDKASKPRHKFNVILGFLAGLLASTMWALMRYRKSSTIC